MNTCIILRMCEFHLVPRDNVLVHYKCMHDHSPKLYVVIVSINLIG